jgi:tRNA threonylcarbamoyladenosine biosynthesis protein TsaB
MLLAIDTATAACSIALIDGDRLIEERHEIVGRGHAERLLPMIEELLRGRRPTSLLVDCGPGSFTGVRVGLAAAHGLAIGWQVPLLGYSSLAVLAVAAHESKVAAALQAGHGQLFVQSYAGDPIAASDALQSLSPIEAAAAASAGVVVGSGAEALVEARGHGEARDMLPRAADSRFLPPSLRNLAPRPIYGRPPDAKPLQAIPPVASPVP